MKEKIRKNAKAPEGKGKHRESSFSLGQILMFAFLFVLMIWIIGFLSLEVDGQKQAIGRLSAELDSMRASGGDALDSYVEKVRELQKIDIKEAMQAELKGVKSEIERIDRDMISKSDLSRLSARIGAVEEHNRTYRGTNLILLVSAGLLREAVERGGGFGPELDVLSTLAGREKVAAEGVKSLRPHAAAGVATLSGLQREFTLMAPNLAFISNNPLGDDPTPRAKIWNRIKGLVKIRRVDLMGDRITPDMIVARTEEHLRLGDVSAAAAEIERLKDIAPEGYAAAQPWLVAAKAKAEADAAVSKINAAAVERTMKDMEKQDARTSGVPAPRRAPAPAEGE